MKINSFDDVFDFEKGIIVVDNNKFLSKTGIEPVFTTSRGEAKICDDSDLYDLLCYFEWKNETHDIEVILLKE